MVAGAAKDEPGNVFGTGSEVSGDDSALTVADNADAREIDVLARFEIGECGFGIRGEVERGGVVKRTGGLRNAALVITKDGNSLSCEIVGKNEKRLVVGDGSVAIERARAGDENCRRKWASAIG